MKAGKAFQFTTQPLRASPELHSRRYSGVYSMRCEGYGCSLVLRKESSNLIPVDEATEVP